MTRTVQAPAHSVRTVDKFLGSAPDRSGLELMENEFSTLTNVRNNELQSLEKRLGGEKAFSQTHTAGTKVRGAHTFVDDSGTETYIKINQDGKVYKSTGGAWSEITASAPGGGFADADAFIATMPTKDTGSSNSDSGTSESGSSTTLTDTDKTFTVNNFVGEVLTVNSEVKLIVANDASKIFVGERFDADPSTDAYTVNPTAQEFFIANGTNFYKCDATTFTQLDNSTFAYAFDGVEAHNQRLWGWKGTRLHYSDAGVGEHFSQNAWINFQTPIKRVASFGEILVIFEERHVSALFGNDPSTFLLVDVLEECGTAAPKSVAVYGDMLFFLCEVNGVVVLTRNKIEKSKDSDLQEPISISSNYIQDSIDAQTEANRDASCGDVNNHHYHLCIDDDWYVLNIDASLNSRKPKMFGSTHWVWTTDDRPNAMDANVLAHFGTNFVVGAQDNGQMYTIEKGNDDDSTDIAMTIEKQFWNPRNTTARKKFWKLNVIQNTTAGAVAMAYSADPDGTTYGSAIETITLNASGVNRFHEIEFPSNPSDNKDAGVTQSYKITETSSLAVSNIEQIELLFYPGVIR